MKFGAHMSIADGVGNALLRGEQVGCETIQIFTKNSNRWISKDFSTEEINKYFENQKKTGISPVVSHTAYLINLASSPQSEVYEKSMSAMKDEINRAEILKIPYLVLHPGAHLGDGEEVGIQRVADRLNKLFNETKNYKVMVLLETTAGQGSYLGCTFEQIAQMIDKIENKNRIGVCLDTCHIFAAGYDIRTPQTYNKTMKDFDDIIGLDQLKIIHLNDTKSPFGSNKDRHEHIGAGSIGTEGFANLVNDKRLKDVPMILETPKGPDMKEDIENLKILKGLIK